MTDETPDIPLDIQHQLSHVRAALGALLIAQFHFDQLHPDVTRQGRGNRRGARIDHFYQGQISGVIRTLSAYEHELDEQI